MFVLTNLIFPGCPHWRFWIICVFVVLFDVIVGMSNTYCVLNCVVCSFGIFVGETIVGVVIGIPGCSIVGANVSGLVKDANKGTIGGVITAG